MVSNQCVVGLSGTVGLFELRRRGVAEVAVEAPGVVAAHRGEGPSSRLVAGDAGAVCLGAGMTLWDAGCACGDTHSAGRGHPGAH